ncbi:MAG: hydantoinase [Desulfobacteraceae bacterium 4572_19]|nr:MAG: hydantoinase [Desulfobacteraceae bacterium 4572_19]
MSGLEKILKKIDRKTIPEKIAEEKISKESVTKEDIKRIVLSTTLTTNAVVQSQNHPETGLIVISGPGIDPEAFRQGEHYYAVSGSIDHRGREVEPINISQIKKIITLLKKDGVKYVGVIGKFSPRNPAHEINIANMLENSFEKVFMGHTISGNLNFPRRIATTRLNAIVYKLHKLFFEAVQKSLAAKGLSIPIHILKADGGTMNLASSMDFPGQSVLSGPAASAMGSIAFAPEKQDVVVIDIGGTTTDISILIDKTPVLEPVGIKHGGYKTLIRSLQNKSIGIGGDSYVKVVKGELIIGPERKGPAMAFGGKHPTTTDALSVLNIMDQGNRENAILGIQPIADTLNVSIIEASEMIFNQACNSIIHEIFTIIKKMNSKPVYTVHEFLDSYKITPMKILIMGGPAPYFAEMLQDISGIETVVLPNWGTANATGAALARTTCEVSLIADTELGFITSPEEDYKEKITGIYSEEDALETAYSLLLHKTLINGSSSDNFQAEVIESQTFDIVKDSAQMGKNIRIKIQAKPGLIHGYKSYIQEPDKK